jgi:hypothetical protein
MYQIKRTSNGSRPQNMKLRNYLSKNWSDIAQIWNSNIRWLQNIKQFNISATTGKIILKFETLANGIKLNVTKFNWILKVFLKSINNHISKGIFIGNPNEKEISRVALLSPACLPFKQIPVALVCLPLCSHILPFFYQLLALSHCWHILPTYE